MGKWMNDSCVRISNIALFLLLINSGTIVYAKVTGLGFVGFVGIVRNMQRETETWNLDVTADFNIIVHLFVYRQDRIIIIILWLC